MKKKILTALTTHTSLYVGIGTARAYEVCR